MREPQKVERLRLPFTPLEPPFGCISAELYQAGLFRVKFQSELGKATPEFPQATLRVVSVLEAHDEIIGISHDDHFAAGMPFSPLVDP